MLTSLATSGHPMSSLEPDPTTSQSVFGAHGFGSGGGQLMWSGGGKIFIVAAILKCCMFI